MKLLKNFLIHLLYYECHKINPNRGGSYMDSPDGIKNKIAPINPVNKKIINGFNKFNSCIKL